MIPLAFRSAARTDAGLFARLHDACFDRSWDEDAFSRLLSRPGASGLLALRPGEALPAGFALLHRAVNEAEILTLGVLPGRRRQGVGRSLLTQGCDRLEREGVARVHLEVAADNGAALALYLGAGFAESGRRPGYYPRGRGAPPADALILTLSLVAG